MTSVGDFDSECIIKRRPDQTRPDQRGEEKAKKDIINMKSYHKLQALTFLIIITFFCQHSHASRALLKDVKSNEMVVAGGNPGKAQLNVTEGKMHKVMAHCEEGHIHHDKAEECQNSANREIEDSDYIYTNSTP